DLSLVLLEDPGLPIRDLPEAYRTVLAAGREMDSVRGERDLMNRAVVTFSCDRTSVGHAGDSNSPVVSGGDHVYSIPGKANGANGPVVASHDGGLPGSEGRDE